MMMERKRRRRRGGCRSFMDEKRSHGRCPGHAIHKQKARATPILSSRPQRRVLCHERQHPPYATYMTHMGVCVCVGRTCRATCWIEPCDVISLTSLRQLETRPTLPGDEPVVSSRPPGTTNPCKPTPGQDPVLCSGRPAGPLSPDGELHTRHTPVEKTVTWPQNCRTIKFSSLYPACAPFGAVLELAGGVAADGPDH
jgi:hypothetical protein